MRKALETLLNDLKSSRFRGRDTRFDENIFGGVFFQYSPNHLVCTDKRNSKPVKSIDKITYDGEFIPKKLEQIRDKQRTVLDNKIEIYYSLAGMLDLLQNDPRYVLSHALKIERKLKTIYKVLYYYTPRDSLRPATYHYAYLRMRNGRLSSMRIERMMEDYVLKGCNPEIKFSYPPTV